MESMVTKNCRMGQTLKKKTLQITDRDQTKIVFKNRAIKIGRRVTIKVLKGNNMQENKLRVL